MGACRPNFRGQSQGKPPWLFDEPFAYPDGNLTGNDGWITDGGNSMQVTSDVVSNGGLAGAGNTAPVFGPSNAGQRLFLEILFSYGTGDPTGAVWFGDATSPDNLAFILSDFDSPNASLLINWQGNQQYVPGNTWRDHLPHQFTMTMEADGSAECLIDGVLVTTFTGPPVQTANLTTCRVGGQGGSSTNRFKIYHIIAGQVV